jgi:hypothetical protein
MSRTVGLDSTLEERMDSLPWILSLATRRRGRRGRTRAVLYDDEQQVAVVRDAGRLIPALARHPGPETKKGDIEKGEDQKDRW